MKKNDLVNHIEIYISNLEKINDKSKARFFLNYLRAYANVEFGVNSLNTPDIFSVLDKDFFLATIESYIAEMQPAKNVAESYKRTVFELSNEICNYYKISNDFLNDHSERADLDKITTELFSNLKPIENRGCMSIDDFEALENEFRTFLNTDNLDYLITQSIKNSRENNHYGKLVSAIAFKLVHQFGLGNNTIAKLKLTDLSTQDRTICINKFILPLDDGLFSNLELYLQSRTIVLDTYATHSDYLFITRTGVPYLTKNTQADNPKLFRHVNSDKQFNVSGLRYRSIARMVSKGANINLIKELTSTSEDKIATICDYGKTERDAFVGLLSDKPMVHITEKSRRPKGQIQCPFCGQYHDASSGNWILIQIDGEQKKHIACKECRGLDGKYRY